MSKSPEDAIREAMERLPSARTFNTVRDAEKYAASGALVLLNHKLALGTMTADERDELDPIEAGAILASDMGTKKRKQRMPHIDKLLLVVGAATFCEIVPMNGTVSAWLIGRRTDRSTAVSLLNALVPTAERLAETAYITEYHNCRKSGDVTLARGYKTQWYDKFVEGVKVSLTSSHDLVRAGVLNADEVFAVARLEVAQYMNDNFLPIRGNKNQRVAGDR